MLETAKPFQDVLVHTEKATIIDDTPQVPAPKVPLLVQLTPKQILSYVIPLGVTVLGSLGIARGYTSDDWVRIIGSLPVKKPFDPGRTA